MATTNFNQKIASFFSTLNIEDWKISATLNNINETSASVNLQTGIDSGWYTPKAIEIKGVDGIYFLRQNGELNYNFKAIQIDGKIQLLEMTMATWNRFERWYSENI